MESPVLPVRDIPVKVVVRSLGKSGDFIVKVHPRQKPGSPQLTAKVTLTIFNPSTRENYCHQVQTDFHFDGDGYCPGPPPFRIVHHPLQHFILNGQISLALDIESTSKTASSVLWAGMGQTFQSSGPRTGNHERQIRRPNRELYGIVGLRNTGASCYLNSVLQVLFHCPAFRRIVYAVDAKADTDHDDRRNVLLNLQILFYEMQFSPLDCSPAALMVSFGWTAEERHTQNDATEMWIVLVDNLRDKFPPPLVQRLASLFFTKSQFVKFNEEIGFRQTTDETFSVLPLSTVHCKTLQEAINAHLSSEFVEEYLIEGFGRPGILLRHEIVVGPEVLVLQLARYGQNAKTFEIEKITTIVEPLPFLEVTIAGEGVLYSLHGAFVHEGGVGGGHYYAFIRPTIDEIWFSISDTSISRVEFPEVVRRSSRDGYFFVYARIDVEEQLYQAVTNDEVPERVIELAKTTNLAFLEMRVITDESITVNCESGKGGFRSDVDQVVEIQETGNFIQLYEYIAANFHLKPTAFRLWRCDWSGKPNLFLKKNETPVKNLFRDHEKLVFIEHNAYEELNADQKLIFLKFFTPAERSVALRGYAVFSPELTIEALAVNARELFGDPAETLYHVFRETHERDAEVVDEHLKLADKTLGCGCILVFQRANERYIQPEDTEATNYFTLNEEAATGKYDFFLTCQHKMILGELFLTFQEDEEPFATIRYPNNITLGQLKSFIAPLVGVGWNPTQNSLLIFSGSGGFPYFVGFENDHHQSTCQNDTKPARLIIQLRDDLSEAVAKEQRTFLIHTVTDRITLANTHAVCYPADQKIGAVLQSENIQGNLLLSESHGGSISDRVTLETILKDLHGNLRVDILRDDWDLATMRILPVMVMGGERMSTISFWLDLQPDETLADTQKRACLLVPDLDPAKVKFEVRFKEHTDERPADTVALWNLYEALRSIDIQRPHPRRRDGPGIVIRN